MLVDLDAFYVSVEQRKDPSLRGKPVIVGGVPGERGVVASASYEARGYGVRAGMPLFQAVALCPKAVFLHGDHADYAAASADVMAILREFAPAVEPVSLDEAFLDFSGCERLHLPSRGGDGGGRITTEDTEDTEKRRKEEGRREDGRRARGSPWPPEPSLPFRPPSDSVLSVFSVVNPVGRERRSRSGRAARDRHSWLDVAEAIHREVLDRAGLSVSIGVGGTKAVASVAAALAKPSGAMEVPRGEERAFLHGLPIEALPGVGPRMRESLARFNLHTVGDLARIPEDVLVETFGVVGASLSRRARGLPDADDDPVSDGRPAAKSISRETSFAQDTADRAVIGGMLSYLAQRATAALRRERALAKGVAVRLRYADFKTVEAHARLPAPTDRDRDVLDAVEALWPRRYDRRVRLRLVGVTLSGLVPVGERQLDLAFDGIDGASTTGPVLDRVVDRVREKHGFGAVVKGQAIGALPRLAADLSGFRLRTPSCSA
jgi:nucleotidyltransferase/DNA polymerase involved in DNA repair